MLRSALAALLCLATSQALAEEGPIDIDVGSARIGGPGTENERAADEAWNRAVEEEETPMSEEMLPAPGNPKRLPGLHKLAKQYCGGQMWKECCEKFDQILSEAGEPGIDTAKDARAKASRSFFECAQIAFNASELDRVEGWLTKSEKLGKSDARHAGLRRKVSRESYRKKLSNGDVGGAVAEFGQFQAAGADEDERIWLGEELAKLAWAAYHSGDKTQMGEMIAFTEKVAPMNTELRALKSKLGAEGAVITNLVTYGLGAIVIVLGGGMLMRWRNRAQMNRLAGATRFEIEDDA